MYGYVSFIFLSFSISQHGNQSFYSLPVQYKLPSGVKEL